VSASEIAPDHEYQQIGEWILSSAVTDWLLVAVGILSWRVYSQQAVILRDQRDILRRQGETLPAVERANIIPTAPIATGMLPDSRESLFVDLPPIPAFMTIKFGNFGKTPGIIKIIRGEIILGDIIPREPIFTYSEPMVVHIVTRVGTQTADIPIHFSRPLSETESVNFQRSKLPAHLFGYVQYTNIFDQVCTTGFCFRVYRIGDTTEADLQGGDEYNYQRITEKPGRS
jgi:hypothetical protein